MLEKIKDIILTQIVPFVANYLVRWSFKFVGSILTYIGWEQSDYLEFVIGILSFFVGIVLTKIHEKDIKEKNEQK